MSFFSVYSVQTILCLFNTNVPLQFRTIFLKTLDLQINETDKYLLSIPTNFGETALLKKLIGCTMIHACVLIATV